MAKELSIRAKAKKETKDRRSSMVIKVMSFNVQKNKLSKEKKAYLKLLNLEAKYYYNYLLSISQVSITDDFGNLVYPNSLFKFNTKSNLIHKHENSSDSYVPYKLQVLSSQVKQEILKKIINSIQSISAAKSKGRRTGKLKFKSFINVPLVQFNNSFYLSDNCKKLSIQGNRKTSFHLIRNRNLSNLSKRLNLSTETKVERKEKGKVDGKTVSKTITKTNHNISLKKLIDLGIIEIANAELISGYKKDSYTFNLTVYVKPEYLKQANLFQGIKLTKEQKDLLNNTRAGNDAGIAYENTLNCNEPYAAISIDSRKEQNKLSIKKLRNLSKYQRRMCRHVAKSKKAKKNIAYNVNTELINKSSINIEKSNLIQPFRNNDVGYHTRSYKKDKAKLNKTQLSITNHKLDIVRKLDSFMSNFQSFTFQDEMVKSWHKNKEFKFSSKIQNGILGQYYAKLKHRYDSEENKLTYQYKKLSSNLRTTKTCICANVNNHITLKDRVYSCPRCEYFNLRDIHSSYIINNTLNHVEYKHDVMYNKTENGCGIQPKDYSKPCNKDLLLNSNLGQVKTNHVTKTIYNLLCIKFKPLNLSIKFHCKMNGKFHTLEASPFMAV